MRADLERRLPQNGKSLDLKGREFARCKVIGFAGYLNHYSAWLCRCECGTLYIARPNMILHRPTGCGCRGGKFQRHGESNTPEHASWCGMMTTHRDRVCERWQTFEKFRADMGPKPEGNYVLSRRDRSKRYTPGNAVWLTRKQAQLSKKCARFTHRGESRTMREWAKRIGISYERLRVRIVKCREYGADVSEALSTPAGKAMPCTRGRYGRPKKISAPDA
jgi:hypothetical protein